MSIIKIENLSKKYIIGHDKAATGMYKYHSFRDSIAHTARGIAQRLCHPLSPNTETTDIEEFWALKDINLEIEQGDKVGIIGRNGAGKSTLLKILSRITEPTSGKITMNGRVASLLEVGTGFHPELTGRENIYLNGAVLGMTRKEIKKKFDEIVDFAGVEKFLDTPVKRYSSGMYVRLAFAVAAHLDPEILLIDEVLAVGDAEFQKKCLGKMEEVSKQGRTILFVSHNMAAVADLCDKIIWLNEGIVKSIGEPRPQIAKYTLAMSSFSIKGFTTQYYQESSAIIQKIRLLNAKQQECEFIDLFETLTIEMDIVQKKLDRPIRIVIRIRAESDNSVVLATTDWDLGSPIKCLDACQYTVQCLIPGNLLNSGTYLLSVGIDEPGSLVHFRLDNMKQIVIVNSSSLGDGLYGDRDGILSPYREWKLIDIKHHSKIS